MILQAEEKQVYQFFVNEDKEVRESIAKAIDKVQKEATKEQKL